MKRIKLLLLIFLVGLEINAQEHTKEYPTKNVSITIVIENDSIRAYALLAAGKSKKETVILLHGFPGNEKNLDLAQDLRRNGRNVIYFNYRGSWGSQGEFLISNLTEDVKQVLDFFSTPENSEKFRVQTDSFILFGHSMGGKVALLSGAKDERVNKITICSPWNYGEGPIPNEERLKEFFRWTKNKFMLNAQFESFTQDLISNWESFQIIQYKNQLNAKKILIVDNNDINKKWIEDLGNIDYVIMKTDHSFSDKRLELIEKVSEWLNN